MKPCITIPDTANRREGGRGTTAGVVETGSDVSRDGCTISLKQISRSLFDQVHVNGLRYDTHGLASRTVVGRWTRWRTTTPNGEPLAAVNWLDMTTHAVTRADLASGPLIDDKGVEYVRSQGLCLEDVEPN